MEGMDGGLVAKEIRQLIFLRGESEVPFICCCTANNDPSFLSQVVNDFGMDSCLTKPISYDELKRLCSDVILNTNE